MCPLVVMKSNVVLGLGSGLEGHAPTTVHTLQSFIATQPACVGKAGSGSRGKGDAHTRLDHSQP